MDVLGRHQVDIADYWHRWRAWRESARALANIAESVGHHGEHNDHGRGDVLESHLVDELSK